MSQRRQQFSPWLIDSRARKHGFELFFGHTALLRPKLLNVETENAGPLRQVINVAAGIEKLEDVAVLHGTPLLSREIELVAVRVLVAQKCFAILGGIE